MSDAPNPCLVIDGYGTIGLPLCEKEAPRIASECALKGTGIYEIPAEKVLRMLIARCLSKIYVDPF